MLSRTLFNLLPFILPLILSFVLTLVFANVRSETNPKGLNIIIEINKEIIFFYKTPPSILHKSNII
jgi:energy-coupling factor transporter transmembrane protein EcfT